MLKYLILRDNDNKLKMNGGRLKFNLLKTIRSLLQTVLIHFSFTKLCKIM